MSFEEEKEKIVEKINETKDTAKIKKEERILKANERRNNARIKVEEKKLEIKKSIAEKKTEAHINLADSKIEEALDDAELSIAILIDSVATEIEEGKYPEELILFRAINIFEEILLRSQLKIQVAKNDLITNLRDDLENAAEIAAIEDNIADVKDKMDTVIGTLEGKIATEKEELNEKYGTD